MQTFYGKTGLYFMVKSTFCSKKYTFCGKKFKFYGKKIYSRNEFMVNGITFKVKRSTFYG